MNAKEHYRRLWILSAVFILLLLVLLARMVWLTVIKQDFLAGQGEARSVRVLEVPAYRGMITDRQGLPLAVSTPVLSLWVNPALFHAEPNELKRLADYLQISENALIQRINAGSNRGFLYLKRHLAPPLAEKIRELGLPGLNFQQEFKRFYPEGRSTAHLLGFTNIDDQGQEGLELIYQDWLMGINGKKKVIKDRKGHIIDETQRLKEPRPGHDLTLSIDRRIQYIAFQELSRPVKDRSVGRFCCRGDAKTGELLALVNAPSFNPNRRSAYDPEHYRNRAFTDAFEPGSVIKPLSLASAIESGKYTPKTVIDTRPSWMMVHKHIIRDIRNYGVLNVQEVLQHSSNVGVSKMVLANPPERLINLFRKCGFGQRTEIAYPGEVEGTLPHALDANPFVLATMGFGYGLSVSAVQMAKAYLAIANHGKMIPVSILYQNNPPNGEQILSKKTADQILAMMETVVAKEGTGKKAVVPGYRVAGKTGTARIAGKNGYDMDRHIASFAGIAPVSDPRLIVMTVIYEPTRGSYYGGAVAAPLFSRIMSGALRILDVPPDKPLTS